MRQLRLPLWCVLLLGLSILGHEARAQWIPVAPAERVSASQEANLFFDWGGLQPLAGIEVDVPLGWSVTAAWATSRDGVQTPLATTGSGDPDRVRLVARQALRGKHRLVVQFEVGAQRGPEQLGATPLVREGERVRALPQERFAWQPYVIETSRRNVALRPVRQRAPLALRRDALPALDARAPFTIEWWMRTVGVDEVVLSTWSGEDGTPYPLELTVAPDGHLLFYRGEQTRHHAMRTAAPIADGQWHHVAFVHDPAAGWSRLLLNGLATDSLRTATQTDNNQPLVLGQRLLGEDASVGAAGYSGLVDEMRIWPRAQTATQIQRTMRRQLVEPPRGVVRLGFDDAPGSLLARDLAAWPTERADLAFSFPIEALDAQAEDGFVQLSWETQDRENEAFVVERSLDGETFQAVTRLELDDRIAEAANGAMRFGYTDLPPASQVVYYRVRQVFGEGPDRISGAVKLGLGDPDAALPLTLVNSPNPFPDRTLVRFEVPEAQRAELSVWDVSGHQVALLLDREVAPGSHEIEFDARDLPSGVYFVRLSTAETSITHKMTLAR